MLWFCSKGPFFTPVAWPGHYLAGPFLFQRILAKTIYLIWKQKRFAIKATTKRRRNIFILIIQNQSVISYYSFFLFYFLDNLILTGIKKTMDFYTMHFFVMISVFLANHIYQNSSSKRKDRTCYLVI